MNKIYLLDFIKPIWKYRASCFLIVLCITSAIIIYSFSLPKLYQSEAIIIPIESSHVSSGGSFSLLGGSGLGGFMGNRSNINRLVMYLSSQPLQKRVAQALYGFLSKGNVPFDDQKLYEIISTLNGMVSVSNDRVYPDKINIQVTGENPQLATTIVKQYIVELQNFITNNILTESKRNRLFLEGQIARVKEETLEMGKALASFYGKNSISAETSKLNVPIGLYTTEGVRNFKNYDEFKNSFEMLQNEHGEKANSETVKFVRDVPQQLYLQYLTTQQQILQEDLGMLNQQYEMAKLEETKQEPSFQVLQEPLVPKFPFSPRACPHFSLIQMIEQAR